MKTSHHLLIVTAVALLRGCCSGPSGVSFEDRINHISRTEMESICELLGNDLYEGRAPGTRGGELAEITMKGLFKYLDLEPGLDGSYMQPFAMKGFTSSELYLNANDVHLDYIDDLVGTFTVEEESPELRGEAVFVGFGISTGIWDWDDYKDVDVKDKIVITRVNDPGMFNPHLFEGDTLTYFGRWTYHIEEAARRGAAGILLIHTDQSAGYNWDVVINSWTGEELFIESDLKNNLRFRGWIRESSLKAILEAKKISLEGMYDQSLSKDFLPVDLGFEIRIAGKNKFREVINHNVIAEIPGKTSERIVLSAHIDHLGMDPYKEGDNIYNGAIDNGSAVGSMMVVAKVLKEFQANLHYSVTLLACNAEESGLLGSKYYAQNTDRSTIIANINFESTPVWGKSGSIMGIGARFSDFETMLKTLALEKNLEYSTFSMANQGLFYRSDQYSFARYGIPSVWISAGEDELSGATHYSEFWGKDYHTVKDEFNPGWELEGMKQTIQAVLLIMDRINRAQSPPQMKRDLPFPADS
jgi:Zn-dependent M28 family amino/carboxypeptidase